MSEEQIPHDLAGDLAEELAENLAAAEAEQAADSELETEELSKSSVAADAARVAELELEVVKLKDQLLRTMAEMENLRNRTRREKEDAIKFAPQKLVTELIGVMDNLHRALSAVPEAAAEENDQLKTLRDGVEMTNREMLKVFERHNITEIEALGSRMDPHSHEALFEIPDPSQPEGTILQVIERGFRLHDRLLRPARVGVAKGGPAGPAKVDTTV
ncbi:nucleotide exchange factor GrpE [Kiloniella laminariae]|uniref:Protein GrpE n=1 Tax=Kiloniella laminariae TaxID=454162 RepID=A0ABT4LJG2_9PROT|nr:nucleotide exchange factor GrpE [Kiloniella laminariae]MCZ4281245.1 nucleotide exchange factor GrpE [Kiloniella laminariae]